MADAAPGGSTAEPNKLCLIIASARDVDRLMDRLVQPGLPATRIGSTGSFLRRGNTTVICGVDEASVDDVIEAVREECHARTEFVPVQNLPFLGDGGLSAEPVEVRVGGGVVFVVDIHRFVRT